MESQIETIGMEGQTESIKMKNNYKITLSLVYCQFSLNEKKNPHLYE